jgi:hypothetical protein
MSRLNVRQEDIDQVDAFLKAGRHLSPSGAAVSLNTFRKDLLANSTVPHGFPTMQVLRDYFPAHERAMRATSLARVAAGGRVSP